jgi:hypothetical protein
MGDEDTGSAGESSLNDILEHRLAYMSIEGGKWVV